MTDPAAIPVTLTRDDLLGWVLGLGEIDHAEAQLLAEVLAEFIRARQVRISTGYPGATSVRVDEAKDRPPSIRGWIEASTPKRTIP